MSYLRDAFHNALAKNEDDTSTRLVYADWLEERGEYDEAERQRKWPAAKAWLVQFCHDHNPPPSEDHEEEWIIDHQTLIQLGREALEEADDEGITFFCGNRVDLQEALQTHSSEFWKNWSIVTGIPLPPDVEDRTFFSCAC